MHKHWLDLLPGYVAGTLSEAEREAVERFLEQNPQYRETLEEWQLMATIVRTDAWERNVPLPPLSSRVRDSLFEDDSQIGIMPEPVSTEGLDETRASEPILQVVSPAEAQPRQQTRRSLPLTLIAAVFAVAITGVVAVLLVLNSDRENDTGTEIAMATEEVTATSTATVASTMTEDTTQDTTITVTPIATAVLPPTDSVVEIPPFTAAPTLTRQPTDAPPSNARTPDSGEELVTGNGELPENSATGNDTNNLAISQAQITVGEPTELCLALNEGERDINIHVGPGFSYNITDTLPPGEQRSVFVTSEGWYEVGGQPPEFGIAGWVAPDNITLIGECDDLVEPSPTQSQQPTLGLDNTCRVSSATPVTIYSNPASDTDSVGTLPGVQPADVTGRNSEGWYLVRTNDGVIGWVDSMTVTISGFCDNVPIRSTTPLTAPTFTPLPTTASINDTNGTDPDSE